jgi:hypothetical protein
MGNSLRKVLTVPPGGGMLMVRETVMLMIPVLPPEYDTPEKSEALFRRLEAGDPEARRIVDEWAAEQMRKYREHVSPLPAEPRRSS